MIKAISMSVCGRLAAMLAPLLFIAAAPAAAEPGAPDRVTVIHAGHLLANPDQPPRANQTIIVRGGRVSEIRNGLIPAADIAPHALYVDLSRSFVMPGLSDVHYHITEAEMSDRRSSNPIARVSAIAFASADQARHLLMAGITSIRDVGDNSNAISFQLRDAIASGKIEGPRILAAGRLMSRSEGHGAEQRQSLAYLMPVAQGGCDGVESCRRVVRETIGDGSGADLIKFTGSGSSSEPWGRPDAVPTSFDDEVQTIVATARQLGRRVAVHAHSPAAINQALAAGAFTIEHGTYFDAESTKLFKARGAYMVPTSFIGELLLTDPRIRARNTPEDWNRIEISAADQQKVAGKAWRAGIRIGVGTDSWVGADPRNTIREIEIFVADGIPAREAIAAATLNNAAILGHAGDLGRIAPHYLADIVAMPGDPLADPAALRGIDFVMKDGAVVRFDAREGAARP